MRIRIGTLVLLLAFLLLPATQSRATSCAPIPSGIVGWWPGDGDGQDLVGTNTASVVGMTFPSGKVGQAFAYSNYLSQAEIPDNAQIDVGAGPGFTLEFWYLTTTLNGQWLAGWVAGRSIPGLLAEQLTPDYAGFPQGQLRLDLVDVNGYWPTYVYSAPVITTNEFQHIAFTYDRGSGLAKILRNGTVIGQAWIGDMRLQTTYDLVFSPGPGTLIDEVALYNRALSDDEVRQIYEADVSGKCHDGAPVIFMQPANHTALSGASINLSVKAYGAQPFYYQWRHDGQDIADATNATFGFVAAGSQAGAYSVVVSNSVGVVISSKALISIIDIMDSDLIVSNLSSDNLTKGPSFYDLNLQAGIAVGQDWVWSGEVPGYHQRDPVGLRFASYQAQRYRAIFSDLRTQRIYCVGTGTAPLLQYDVFNPDIATSLIELDPGTLNPTGAVISLSQAIDLRNGPGFFSGLGRVVIHDGSNVFDVSIPSGEVTDLGPMAMPPHATADFGYWGIAEYFNGRVHLLYSQDGTLIARTSVPDGATAIASGFAGMFGFTGPGTSAIGISIPGNRWYASTGAGYPWYGVGAVSADGVFAYNAAGAPPSIGLQPVSSTNGEGASVMIEAAAFGEKPLHYQWRLNDVDVPGADQPQLTFQSVSASNFGAYTVVVTNVYGVVTSSVATLKLELLPTIGANPTNLTVRALDLAMFFVDVSGEDTTIQWCFNGTPIFGATDPTLTIMVATPCDAGVYTAVITNYAGSVTSSPAMLVVDTVPFADALDTGSSLTWTTGGDCPWFGQVFNSIDFTGAAASGHLQPGQNSWISTTVTGPGTIMFQWMMDSAYNEAYEVVVDGETAQVLAPGSWWEFNQIQIPPGTHTVTWMMSRFPDPYDDNARAYLDQVIFSKGRKRYSIPFDLTGTQTNSDGFWFSESTVRHSGTNAYQSGQITDGASSEIDYYINGPGQLTFWWKVSSEPRFDTLQFQIDGNAITNISGEIGWRRQTYRIGPGQHYLTWIYSKDWGTSQGADAGWVDDVTFTPERRPLITRQLRSQTVFEGDNAVFSVSATSEDPNLFYQWVLNGIPRTSFLPDANFFKVPAAGPSDVGFYNVVLSDDAGSQSSVPALLQIKPRVSGAYVLEGKLARLKAFPAGVPRRLQWYFGSVPVTNSSNIRAHGRVLTIRNASATNDGFYSAVDSDTQQTIGSKWLTLITNTTPVLQWGALYQIGKPPETLADVVAVAAGYRHALALNSDGTVVAWGDNSYDQTNVPEGLSDVTQIAAGQYHSLALRADGTIIGWGSDDHSEIDDFGLTDLIAIAAAGNRSMALTRDGKVAAWGEGENGQGNVPENLSNVTAIAAGPYHSLAVTGGRVVAWGDNSMGQCDVPVNLSNVVAVAAGPYNSLALKRDGTVAAWGSSLLADNMFTGTALTLRGLSGVKAIATSGDHNVFLKKSGRIFVWGMDQGVLGPYFGDITPQGIDGVTGIAAGSWFTLAIRNRE